MRSSDLPPQVEQAAPSIVTSILPEPVPDEMLSDEKPKTEHPADSPVNPYRANGNSMFARSVFPRFDLIGPVPMETRGLCGLAPDSRMTWKKRIKPPSAATSDQD